MRTYVGMVLKSAGALAVAVLLGGCVSLEKYNELEIANRNCNQERERLRSELADAQVKMQDLQRRLNDYERGTGDKDAKIKALEEQADKYLKMFQDMQETYKQLAERVGASGVTFLTQPLPPELDSALKEFAAKYPGQVEYDAKRGMVKFSTDIVFDLGSDEVKPQALASLSDLAKIITSPAAGQFDVLIAGHTDNTPIVKTATKEKFPTNWHLSAARAISVLWVLKNGGVAENRMGVAGYGEYWPLVPNDSPKNKALNRRVELFLVPKRTVGVAAPAEAKPAPAKTPAKIEK